MLVVKKLLPSIQQTYFRFDSKQPVSLKFKLKEESYKELLKEASNCKGELDIEKLENTIYSVARYLVMRLTKEELADINSWGTVIKQAKDPFNSSKEYVFEFQNLDNNDINEITVTKIKILCS